MKLIFIYGPPAVGKLTIAEKLSERTGIALFHNHLTRDIVRNIYGDKTREHYELIDTLRLDVFEYCARHNTSLIFTYVYEGPTDDVDIHRFKDVIESNGGQVQFVELTANQEDLIARADGESRKRFQKITDPGKMAAVTEDMNKFSIPYVISTKINTSELSPEQSVEKIVGELAL